MKAVHCPCGEVIEAETDDELVEKTQQHVREDHPELESEYTREKILSIAHEHQPAPPSRGKPKRRATQTLADHFRLPGAVQLAT